MSDKKVAKCPVCGHEWEGSYAKSSLRLHLLQGECGKVLELAEKEKQELECKHEYRLLNRSVPAENRAYIEGGYREVCDACKELR